MIKHKGVLTQPCVGNNQRLSQATNTNFNRGLDGLCVLDLLLFVGFGTHGSFELFLSLLWTQERQRRRKPELGREKLLGYVWQVWQVSAGLTSPHESNILGFPGLCIALEKSRSETNQNAVPRFRLVVSLSIQFRAHFRIFACGASRFSKGTFAPPCFLVVIRHDFQILDFRFVPRILKLYSLTSIKVDFLQVL